MQDPRHDEENHIKNYVGTDAIEKLRSLAEDARICMFSTFTAERPMPSRPMALQEVDDTGNLYFFSAASSDKNKQIAVDPAVQLYFANTANSEYLSVYGFAAAVEDDVKKKELWNAFIKTWFQGGVDDPDLTLIRVVPHSCNYWDTKHNKMIMWAKMAVSMLTGKTMDDAVEGNLNVGSANS